MSLWHYTVASYYAPIIESGAILPATGGIAPGERAAVWFSRHPEFEPTARKGLRDGRTATLEEMIRITGGLLRIRVAPQHAPHDWLSFQRKARCPKRILAGLEKTAHDVGANPNDWRVSFVPVPAEHWLSIEFAGPDLVWTEIGGAE